MRFSEALEGAASTSAFRQLVHFPASLDGGLLSLGFAGPLASIFTVPLVTTFAASVAKARGAGVRRFRDAAAGARSVTRRGARKDAEARRCRPHGRLGITRVV